MYRGELVEAEDSWNVQLKNVTATSKVLLSCKHATMCSLPSSIHFVSTTLTANVCMSQDGRNSHLEHIFIRGSRVR